MDEVTLNGGQAVLIDRIRTVDRDLDVLERETPESVIRGPHSARAALGPNLQQTAADVRRTRLLTERPSLVERLRRSVEDSWALRGRSTLGRADGGGVGAAPGATPTPGIMRGAACGAA